MKVEKLSPCLSLKMNPDIINENQGVPKPTHLDKVVARTVRPQKTN